jgi:DNA ligase (NAD+)
MNIDDLEEKIIYYATKYYNGEPEISDAEFDRLTDLLRSLKPNSSVLRTGWGFEVVGDKVKHKYSHIGSLDKTKSYKDIPDRFKFKTIFISPKLDGLSAVAYYESGKLVQGITRGNGEYGKDITNKLKVILGNEIPDKTFTGAVRGELIINDRNWLFLQGKYKELISPRNFAAGIINRKELDEDIIYIDMVVYKVVGQEGGKPFERRDEILHWLALNFTNCIPEYYYPVLNEQSWDAFHNQTFEEFKKLGYGLDGLVLTSSDVVYSNQTFGYVYDECAFKFDAETTTTFVKYIEWTLSRTSRMVPVAVLEPVELSGAVINRATCNNAKMVKDWGLGEGAEIQIQRANEVIPHIVSVIQESNQELPTVCPACQEKLIWDGVDLKCGNVNCSNIDASDLQQWCECIGETDGLQYTIMSSYLQVYGVTNLRTLYEKKREILEDLNNRQLSLTEQKIKEFFCKLYIQDVDADRALQALNIPRLGDKTSQLLASNSWLYMEFLDVCLNKKSFDESLGEQLLDLLKEATTKSLLSNSDKFRNLQYLYDEQNSRYRLKFGGFDKTAKFIAVTGALESMKRKDFEKLISTYGYSLSSNLKKCDYLVNNDVTSNSAKNQQAKEFGIPIISEKEFLEKIL